jgi:hypothetical protein
MQDLRMNIHFFDFVDKYYSELKELNVITTSKWTKHDKTTVESSHPPKESILTNVGKDLVKASPFKLPPKTPEKDEERKIIGQNNYTNKCLNVIGDQLDKIESKIDSINIKLDSYKIETPLIKTQELKTGLSLKTSQTKTREKIDQMLKELNKVKGEPSTINVINKNGEVYINIYENWIILQYPRGYRTSKWVTCYNRLPKHHINSTIITFDGTNITYDSTFIILFSTFIYFTYNSTFITMLVPSTNITYAGTLHHI